MPKLNKDALLSHLKGLLGPGSDLDGTDYAKVIEEHLGSIDLNPKSLLLMYLVEIGGNVIEQARKVNSARRANLQTTLASDKNGIRLLARALYDDGHYKQAADAFGNCGPHSESPKDLLLHAYSYEQAATTQRDLDHAKDLIDRAIGIAAQLPKDHETVAKGEVEHCRGHIYLTKARLALNFDSGDGSSDAIMGIGSLKNAAEQNWAYASCYSSSYSDLRMFWETIKIPELEPKDGSNEMRMVSLEQQFYRAMALSSSGLFGEAANQFDKIRAEATKKDVPGLPGLKAHVTLFQIKNEVRQTGLAKLTATDIKRFQKQLEGLNLRTRSAIPAQRERNCLLKVLKLIHDVRTDTADSAHFAVSSASDLIEYLGEFGPGSGITFRNALTVYVDESSQIPQVHNQLTKTLVKDNLGLDTESPAVRIIEIGKAKTDGGFASGVAIYVDKTAFTTTKRGKVGEVVLPTRDLAEAYQRAALLVVRPQKSNTPTPRSAPFSGEVHPDELNHYFVVFLALQMASRFLSHDRYVANLAPCEDSPALRFQKPQLTLEEFFAYAIG